jgi:hypothetical protein
MLWRPIIRRACIDKKEKEKRVKPVAMRADAYALSRNR